jgi:hypothetical protein
VIVDDDGLHLWINHGSQGFIEATPAAETAFTAIVALDIDRDVDIDLVIAGGGGVGILENLRHGQFSFRETAVELSTQELLPLSGDLHPRGFSRIEQTAGVGPERFAYDQVDPSPKWPPMSGAFTRFGDVRELLLSRDDQLVVMGSGDEMTLRFEAPPIVQEGWERDFVLAIVGWDKDANLATAAGDSAEPLPFSEMQSYPPAIDDPPPDTDAYRAYLLKYQTR